VGTGHRLRIGELMLRRWGIYAEFIERSPRRRWMQWAVAGSREDMSGRYCH